MVEKTRGEIMLSYEDAAKTILNHIKRLEAVEKPIPACAGYVTTGNVYAGFDLPQTAVSGPDGYAVRSRDIEGATKENPVVLRIIATARAGRPAKNIVGPGTAIRIMTGSVLPKGADCVVRFEDTDEPVNKNGPNKDNPLKVAVYAEIFPGGNVRQAGSNIRKGTLIVPEGTMIGPAQISTLVSLGKARAKVIRRPVVAIIATGDELVSMGGSLALGKTHNSNAPAIASLVAHYGGIPKVLGIARDTEASLISKIGQGILMDAIITSGGVSKGDYDLVRLVLEKMGKLIFSRIKMGPGAAVAFGMLKRPPFKGRSESIPIFSLAGPPSGCLVNFETLVRPAILKMRGISVLEHPAVEAIAKDSLPGVMPMAFVKYTYLEQIQGKYHVSFNTEKGEGMLISMTKANSLTIVPEGTAVKEGDKVRVLPLSWCDV